MKVSEDLNFFFLDKVLCFFFVCFSAESDSKWLKRQAEFLACSDWNEIRPILNYYNQFDSDKGMKKRVEEKVMTD